MLLVIKAKFSREKSSFGKCPCSSVTNNFSIHKNFSFEILLVLLSNLTFKPLFPMRRLNIWNMHNSFPHEPCAVSKTFLEWVNAAPTVQDGHWTQEKFADVISDSAPLHLHDNAACQVLASQKQPTPTLSAKLIGSQVCWLLLVIPALWEAEARVLL